MKEKSSRLLVIVALTLLSAWAVHDPSKYRLGPDLDGGTILIYQKSTESGPSASMDKLMPALKERLDPAGLFNYVIRPLGVDRVEIIMPKAQTEDVDRVKRLVSTVGQLQFKIVADSSMHGALMDRARNAWPDSKIVGAEGVFVKYGVWNPIETEKEANKELVAKAEAAWPQKIVGEGIRFKPLPEFVTVKIDPKIHLVKRDDNGIDYVLSNWSDDGVKLDEQGQMTMGPSGTPVRGAPRNLVRVDEATGDKYVLMYQDQYNVTGEYLTRVEPTTFEGTPAVNFNFNSTGAKLFYELTTEFQPKPDGTKYQLGVILDNRLRSAPALNARISSSGVITGNFTQQEIQELVQILDAGQLPFALEKEPSSQFQIAPTLGLDTIRKGTFSIIISLIAVMAFVGLYYRVAGLVAILGLTLNLLFTVALMVLFRATWTLPGLAGLVLTVGMSVDANILIFERMREELERGASFAMALRNGYDKAFSAILDGNLTTVVTAIILFLIGTDQVKGFAVTLILGIITSMFCVLFVTRAIFEALYASRRLKSLSMLKMFSKPNLDYFQYKSLFFGVSGSLIVLGIAAVFLRGGNNFDVDFTGGTMVGMHLNKQLDTAEVRKRANEVLPDVSVEEVRLQTDEPGSHFVIRTTERDAVIQEGRAKEDTVRGKLARAFKDYLSITTLKYDDVEKVPAVGGEKKVPPGLGGFVGGEMATVTLSEPQTVEYLKSQFTDLLAQKQPGVDPNFLYVVVPLGKSSSPGEETFATYAKFQVAMKSNLQGTLDALQVQISSSPTFEQFSQFGPQVAGETQQRAIFAVIFSWVSIIIYVWFRFGSWTFGLAGVVALVHDVLVAVGVLALISLAVRAVPALEYLTFTDMKINLNGIAAILTLIGFSINDTIVIFDRIREIRGKSPTLTKEIINRAVNETLSRTIFTSLTVLMVVVILYLGCGVDLRGFSFILVVGVIVGSYSTVFIANPVLYMLSQWNDRRNAKLNSKAA